MYRPETSQVSKACEVWLYTQSEFDLICEPKFFGGFMSQPTDGPTIGEFAPDFKLPYTRTEAFTLSEQRGKKKVAICFYVLDFTSG